MPSWRNWFTFALISLLASGGALAQLPTFKQGWFLAAELSDSQATKVALQSEDDFTIAVVVKALGKPEQFKFTTRPRTLRYHLLSSWDGVDFTALPQGEVIATQRVPGFQYGGIGATVTELTFSDGPRLTAPYEAGDYYVSACLPRGSGGGESELARRLANDVATLCSQPVKLEVAERPRPDLFVEFVATSLVRRLGEHRGVNFVGDRLDLRATIRNQGDAATAFGTQVHFFMASPSAPRTIVIDPERAEQLGSSVRVGTLEAGEEVRHSLVVESPPSRGTYRFGACVGAIRGLRVAESNLTNNCSRARAVTFETPPNCGWDLSIESIETPPGVVRRGEPIPFDFTIRNQGGRTSPPATLTMEAPNRPLPVSGQVPGIAAGETAQVRLELTILDRQTGVRGEVTESVCVIAKQDCNNRNNCTEYAIEVEP